MIHVSEISRIAEHKLPSGEPKPFSLKFVKENGAVVVADEVIMTSCHSTGYTINIKFPNGQMRKVRTASIIEFNSVKTFM